MNIRGHSELNQGPAGLQPDALPLSYIPACPSRELQNIKENCYLCIQFHVFLGEILSKKSSVRNGIRTHALKRGPEVSSLLSIGEQGLHLESGALDHSAILTYASERVK